MKKKLFKIVHGIGLGLFLLIGQTSMAQTGAALNFGGFDDRVNLGSGITTSLTGSTKLTVEAWVRTTGSTAGLANLVSNYNTNVPSQLQFLLRRANLGANGNFEFFVGNSSIIAVATAANTNSLNTWMHVAGTYDGSILRFYINGVLTQTASSGAITSLGAAGSSQVWIGGSNSNEYHTGDLDEVRIWNIARSQADIQATMNCEINGAQANLIANYHFNQGIAAGTNTAVTTAIDDSGNSYTGTLTNMALTTGSVSNWVAPGGVTSGLSCNGAALNFDGVNDIVQVPNASNLNFGIGDFSVEAKIKTGVSQPNFTGITVKSPNSGSILGWQLLTFTNSLAVEINNPAGSFFAVGTSTLNDNNWHHVALIVNRAANNVKLLVDGVVQVNATSVSIATMNVTNTASLLIGVERTNALRFNGNIDEVRLWNVARTQCEINTYMNSEIPTNAAGLVANYHFNQGIAACTNTTVTTLIDATSNLNNGLLTSFSLTGTNSNWVSPGGVVSGNTVVPNFSPTLSVNNGTICSGNTFTIVPSGASTYTIQGGSAAVSPTANATYTVIGTSTAGCLSANTATSNVTVNALPTVSAASSNTTFICVGSSATLTASGASSYVWNTTATTAVIAVSPTTTTSYTVTGTGANGCSANAVISQSVSTCTGIDNLSFNVSNISFQVYPNPSNGIFNVQLENAATIEITDVLGRVILTDKVNAGNYQLNLGNNVNGVYFVKATVDGKTKTVKIVKE